MTKWGISYAYTWYKGTKLYFKPKYEPQDIPDIDLYTTEVLDYIIDEIISKDVVIKKISPVESLYDYV